MPAYAVAQMSVHDPERYGRYVGGFLPVLEQYGGRLLAAQTAPDVVEGEWPHGRIVILEFDDRAALERWASSPEYSAIVGDRRASAESVVVIADRIE